MQTLLRETRKLLFTHVFELVFLGLNPRSKLRIEALALIQDLHDKIEAFLLVFGHRASILARVVNRDLELLTVAPEEVRVAGVRNCWCRLIEDVPSDIIILKHHLDKMV